MTSSFLQKLFCIIADEVLYDKAQRGTISMKESKKGQQKNPSPKRREFCYITICAYGRLQLFSYA